MKGPDSIRDWPLRRKLIFSFVTLVMIPVLVLSAYTAIHSQREMAERVEKSFSDSAYQISMRVSHQFEQYNAGLRLLVMNRQITGIFEEEEGTYFQQYSNMTEILDPMLLMVRQLTPGLDSVGVYTDNVNLKEHGESVLYLNRLRESPWWGQVNHRPLLQWFRDGDDLLGLALLMRTSSKSPESFAYVRLPLNAAFSAGPENLSQFGMEIRKGNEALYSQRVNMELPDNSALEQGVHRIDGRRILAVSYPIEATGWTLWVYCPYDALVIDVSGTLRSLAALAAVSLLLLSLVGLLISNSISRRISRLNEAFSGVEAGRLDETIETSRTDEIGELTRHYNRMVTALNEYIRINYEDRILLREAELKALQAQINPHFLYNSLSLINWKALELDAMEIREIVSALSSFYRSVLNQGKSRMTVACEMTNVEAYLKIQSYMHSNSFETVLNIEPEIMDCEILGVILQPIVENAIEHGIDCRRDPEGARIEITGRADRERLVFSVRDNGPGMTSEQFALSIAHSSKSYGLKNVQDRVKIAYGEEYGLRLDTSVTEGARVLVIIPRIITEKRDINPKNLAWR